jgi:hypothetical protein
MAEALPTDGEMAERLSALKGIPEGACSGGTANSGGGVGFYHASEANVPDSARADQLLSRMADEVALDQRSVGDGGGRQEGETRKPDDPERDIAERLAKLRGLSVR